MNNLLKRTFINIRRSGWRAYAVIFMMTMTYFMLAFLMIVTYTSARLADNLAKQLEVIGFFKDDVTEEQILSVKQKLDNNPYVTETKYVSKEDAMASFLDANRDNKDILEAVTVNVFPAHLNVKTVSLDNLSDVANIFRSNELIEDVLVPDSFKSTIQNIVMDIQIISAALLLIFLISTVFIIFLAIGVTIYSHKDEIMIMKLVGATNGYVRMPYILQSLFYSLTSVLIALSVVTPIMIVKFNEYIGTRFGVELSKAVNVSVDVVLIGVAIELLFAVLFAVLSSYFATKRYINT